MEEESINPHGDEPYDPKDPHHEANWYKSVFKLPIEVIADSFWLAMEGLIWEPAMLTSNVRGTTELGGKLPEAVRVDEPYEHWWGVGPTPRSINRRQLMREARESRG